MWTDGQFWKDSTWRAFRTFCQTLAALLGGQTFTALTAPWQSMLSVALTAALISLFQSIDRGRKSDTVVETKVVEVEAAPAPVKSTVPEVIPMHAEHTVVASCGDLLKD